MLSMRNGNRKQYEQADENRPNYLRYGDVFMTSQRRVANRVNNSINSGCTRMYGRSNRTVFQTPFSQSGRGDDDTEITQEEYSEQPRFPYDDSERINEYNNENILLNNEKYADNVDYSNQENLKQVFSRRNTNRLIDRDTVNDYLMNQLGSQVRMQRMQLPQLQQYRCKGGCNQWDSYCDYDNQRRQVKRKIFTQANWQKFVITFTSLLSIMCLTWIVYSWNNDRSKNEINVIKPEKPFFKVLPDTPGGREVQYQDKSVYNRVDPTISQNQPEHIVGSVEEPDELPVSADSINNNSNLSNSNRRAELSNYTIIDDRDYYVKCKRDSDLVIAQKQVALIRQKLNSYPERSVLSGVSCSMRKVANSQGQMGEYILIGPFSDDIVAGNIGRFCQIKGEIITVSKKQN